jgi:hypothetical protein
MVTFTIDLAGPDAGLDEIHAAGTRHDAGKTCLFVQYFMFFFFLKDDDRGSSRLFSGAIRLPNLTELAKRLTLSQSTYKPMRLVVCLEGRLFLLSREFSSKFRAYNIIPAG